ncbi:MAG: hypothetical protein HY074_20765 [Deltaproteobacteria bacterium]|nr:hypothetical protein [Deltaproteobacteria bacterium]
MIKADGPAKVKISLYVLLMLGVCFCAPTRSLAQVSEKEVQGIEQQEFGIESGKKQKTQAPAPKADGIVPEDYQPAAEPEKVKPIEAEEFRVIFKKSSHSGRVMMFEDATDNRPRPGKILLLKKDNDDVVAIRVLKNYPGKFAAKTVLPINELKPDTEYRAIKKLGEKIIALIREREKRGKDLDSAKTDEDLAKEVSPDDNELDRGIPLQKGKTKKVLPSRPDGAAGPGMPEPLFSKDGGELSADSIEIKDEDEPYNDLSVQEDLPIEPNRHSVTLEYGSLKSVDQNANPATYSGVGLRYGFNIWRMALFHRKSLQDMVTLEAGLFYYTIAGFVTADDSVTVYPFVGDLRYTLLIGESLGLFGYLGFTKTYASAGNDTSVALTAAVAGLNTTRSALGVGATLKIGPSWAVRLDVGTDLFGIGAVLKF